MIPDPSMQRQATQAFLTKIREGIVTAIELEVDRCRNAGIPMYISRGEGIEVLMPDGSIHPFDGRPSPDSATRSTG